MGHTKLVEKQHHLLVDMWCLTSFYTLQLKCSPSDPNFSHLLSFLSPLETNLKSLGVSSHFNWACHPRHRHQWCSNGLRIGVQQRRSCNYTPDKPKSRRIVQQNYGNLHSRVGPFLVTSTRSRPGRGLREGVSPHLFCNVC